MLRLAVIRFIESLVDKAFSLQQWYVGWAQVPVHEFLQDPGAVRFNWVVPDDKRTFIADPFGVETAQGGLVIIAERLVQGRSHGEIVRIDATGSPRRDWRLLLRKDWHLSYPFIVHDAGRRLVVPEQGPPASE